MLESVIVRRALVKNRRIFRVAVVVEYVDRMWAKNGGLAMLLGWDTSSEN